jgi:hypothetical protein
VIAATCAVHGGATGYTNVVIRKIDGRIELDPHADRSCVLVLEEVAASALRDALIEWLG